MANKSSKKTPQNKKRNVKKGQTNKKEQKKFLGSRARRLFIVALIATGAIKLYDINNSNQVTVARVIDAEGDEFDKTMQVYDENGNVIAEIGENSIVITSSNIPKDKEEMVNVSAVNAEGDNIVGKTAGKYLEKIKKVNKSKLEKYDTVYTVVPDDGVNVRSSAKVSSKNKLGAIESGEQVLGSTKLAVENNDFLWVPIMYVNEKDIMEGYIRSDLLRENGTIEDIYKLTEDDREKSDEEKRIKMIVDTSKENNVNLKLRSDTVRNAENIVTEIPDGSVIYAIGKNTKNNDAIDWRKVEYTDGEGNTYTGWVSNAFLEEYNEIEKVVDTSSDGKINLNVRKEPGTSSEKIAEIQHGTKIKIPEADIESRQTVDGTEWVKVTLSDGTVGYVSYGYLEDVEKEVETENTSEVVKKVIDQRTVSKSGKVVGIDVADSVTGEQLEKLLKDKNAIGDKTPRLVYNTNGEAYYADANTSDIAGNINYVYIKIAASGYKKFVTVLNENYLDQAEVCEKLGIPYGFYYYSTAINPQEAKKEAEAINKALSSVKSRNYNLLPFAIDVELAPGTVDRQYGKNVTETKAYLANLLEPKQGKTILYGGGRSISSASSESILNVGEYNKLLETGDTDVWLASPRTSSGGLEDRTETYIDSISKHSKITVSQTLLDAKINETKIDINMIDDKEYKKMIQRQGEEIVELALAQDDSMEIE